jgi:SWI/SNF-related matrix-associated actin-dependent regulator of chromatin subfamily A-like protein 1
MATQLEAARDVASTTQRVAAGLFPHQVEGVAFLLRRRRAILADDMGLGKTRQAIIALRVESRGQNLVVCPASVKRNWEREIRAVRPEDSVQVVAGRSDQVDCDAQWVIVNYDILAGHMTRLAATPWQGIVFDEAHYLKNHDSQRSRHCRRIIAAAGDPAVFALTGTPMTNRPRDLFPLLQLCGHPMARSFLSFAKRYCAAHHNGYGWVTDGASNLEELAVQLQGVMLRRTKDEVLELPPKLRTWLPVTVPVGTGAREMGDVVRLLLRRHANPSPSPRRDEGADRGRLLANLTKARLKVAAAKTSHTIEYVENAVAQGEKVIVFSCFDEPLKRIATHFGNAAVLLTGATPTPRRQALVDRFQGDDGVRVFAANIVAGGVGLNLTAARQVVFNDLDWVPANHWQAEDRAYRIGQANSVHVAYMCAEETIDEFVASVLRIKEGIIEAVVEGEALGEFGGDVLGELERLLAAVSPGMADYGTSRMDAGAVAEMMRKMRDMVKAGDSGAGTGSGFSGSGSGAGEGDSGSGSGAGAGSRHSAAMEAAMRLLEQALMGEEVVRYRVASNSRPGESYELEVDAGGDVVCSCPGFGYRGQCSHGRTLKAALARRGGLPKGYEAVAE